MSRLDRILGEVFAEPARQSTGEPSRLDAILGEVFAEPARDEGFVSRAKDTATSAAVGLASSGPLFAAQGTTLARAGIAAAQNPMSTLLRGQAAVHDFLGGNFSPLGAMGSAGEAAKYLARRSGAAIDSAADTIPLAPMPAFDAELSGLAGGLHAVSGAIGAAAPARAHEPFTPEAVAFSAFQSAPQMGMSIGAAIFGGAVGGPVGARLGAFAASFFAESASIVDESYRSLKEHNPSMSEEEALTRAFVPSIMAAAPAAGLDALAGPEAAVAKVARKEATLIARGLARRFLDSGKVIGKSGFEEFLTEPVQGVIEETGQAAATRRSNAPITGQDVQEFGVRRGMEALVGGAMGLGGGGIAGAQEFARTAPEKPPTPAVSRQAGQEPGQPGQPGQGPTPEQRAILDEIARKAREGLEQRRPTAEPTAEPEAATQDAAPDATPEPADDGIPNPDIELADGTPLFNDRARAEQYLEAYNAHRDQGDPPAELLPMLDGAAFAVAPRTPPEPITRREATPEQISRNVQEYQARQERAAQNRAIRDRVNQAGEMLMRAREETPDPATVLPRAPRWTHRTPPSAAERIRTQGIAPSQDGELGPGVYAVDDPSLLGGRFAPEGMVDVPVPPPAGPLLEIRADAPNAPLAALKELFGPQGGVRRYEKMRGDLFDPQTGRVRWGPIHDLARRAGFAGIARRHEGGKRDAVFFGPKDAETGTRSPETGTTSRVQATAQPAPDSGDEARTLSAWEAWGSAAGEEGRAARSKADAKAKEEGNPPGAAPTPKQLEQLQKIYASALAQRESFNAGVDAIAQTVGGQSKHGPIKKPDRILFKVNNPNDTYDGDVTKVKDVVRSTIVVSTEDAAASTLAEIRGRFDVLRVKDRFTTPTDLGYRDMLINVTLPGGAIAEIQVNIPEIVDYKNGPGHTLYVRVEAIKQIDPAARTHEQRADLARMIDESVRGYDAALEAARRRVASAMNSASEGVESVWDARAPGRSSSVNPSSESDQAVPANRQKSAFSPSQNGVPDGNLSGSGIERVDPAIEASSQSIIGQPPAPDEGNRGVSSEKTQSLADRLADAALAREFLLSRGYADDAETTRVAGKLASAQAEVNRYRGLNTLKNPEVRSPEYADDKAREELRARAVEELMHLQRPEDDDKITLGFGGSLPRTPLQRERHAIVVLGPPASGKSGIATRLADNFGARIVDSDFAKRKIPEFLQSQAGAMLTHAESQRISAEVLLRATQDGDNIVLPTVGETYENTRPRIEAFRAAGYRVAVVEVRLHPDVVVKRAVGRFLETGRYVPIPYIIEVVGTKPSATYNRLRDEGAADEHSAVSTDVERGSPPIQLDGQPPQPQRGVRAAIEGRGGNADQRVEAGGRRTAEAGDRPQDAQAPGSEPEVGPGKEPGDAEDGGLASGGRRLGDGDPRGSGRGGRQGPREPGAASGPGVAGPDPDAQPRQPGGRRGGDGRGAEPADRAGGVASGPDAGATDDAARGGADPGRPDAGGTAPRADAPRARTREALTPAQQNHVIKPGVQVAPSTDTQRFEANLRALRLLRRLEKEAPNPETQPHEKEILAQYTGWGWAGQIFDEHQKKHASKRKQMLEVMTQEEYESARGSTTNAHYTSDVVVRPMWELVRRLGFTGGRVLEPGAGTGNFFGMMPQDLAGASELVGVELDDLTGRILARLYPQADVRIAGFEKTKLADNSFDLAIGNVPFSGRVKPNGPDYKDLLLHDYFFARALDKTKPGGLVVFITSDGTLNKSADGKRVRGLLAQKADLVGAIRLPNNAFAGNAGTEVTTDILVFRKKDGRPFTGQPFLSLAQVGQWPREKILEPLQRRLNRLIEDRASNKLPWGEANAKIEPLAAEIARLRDGPDQLPIVVNEYFANNPEMALGQHSLAGTMYGPGDYALVAKRGQDLGAALDTAIARLPANIMGDAVRDEDASAHIEVREGDRIGSYVHRPGEGVEFYSVERDSIKPADWLTERLSGDDWAAKIDAKERMRRIEVARAWFPLRDAAKDLMTLEGLHDADETQMKRARQRLNRVYDGFVEAHGTLNHPTQEHRNPAGFLAADPDYFLVQSLEEEKQIPLSGKTAKAGKGKGRRTPTKRETDLGYMIEWAKHPIFERRTRQPKAPPARVSSVEDAIAVSLGHHNRIDPSIVAGLLDVTPDVATARILDSGRAFTDPKQGLLVPREQYLSGNVRKKLHTARAAMAENPDLQRNVEALESVQPADIPITRISMTPASRWVPDAVTSAFASEFLGTEVSTRYVPALNSFRVTLAGASTPAITEKYAVRGETQILLDGIGVLKHAMDGTRPVVQVWEGWGKDRRLVTLAAETHAAMKHVETVVREFQSWVKTTSAKVMHQGQEMAVQDVLERVYNEQFNGVIPVDYDGSYLALPGMSDVVRRLPHRLSVVARILQEGAAVMAHGVGSGKTFSIIVAAMELRRLGLARKPMVVVQKATVGQFAASWRQAYPDAKILVANEKTFSAKNRKRLMAQAALGDWDAIVVTQPQYERLEVTPEVLRAYINDKIDALRDAMEAEKASSGSKRPPTVKQIEDRIRALENKLESTLERMAANADRSVYFQDLGVDFLFVDEAHAYKNLPIETKKVGIKGIPSGASLRAINTKLKAQNIQEKRGDGSGVVFATGTPVTNTMAEVYVMLDMATPRVLEDYGIRNFDEFADTFGATKSDVEYTWSQTYKAITRFKKFVNGQELISLIRAGFDVKMGNKELGLEVPDIEGGTGELVKVPPTEGYLKVSDWLLSAASMYEEMEPREKRDATWVPITVMQTGMAAALDPRLVDPSLPDEPGSKVNTAADRIAKIYRDTAGIRGTQIVFADRFSPMSTHRLDGFIGGIGDEGRVTIDATHMDPEAETTRDVDEDDAGERDAAAAAKAEANAYKGPGFNLYRDLKAKLVARGIPENEIAIIHDFNTNEARTRLFEKMNAGAVRVLIGSTERAGVGVNIQARLVAMHQMDPPRSMTPAMKEQREGRIIRQGNLFATRKIGGEPNPHYIEGFKAQILYYGTEKSADTSIYQLIENKQRFITQALMGRTNTREFDDPADEATLGLSQLRAELTGDKRVIRMAELRASIADLELSKTAWENAVASRGTRLRYLASDIEYTARTSREHRALAKEYAAKADQTNVTVKGVTVSDPEAAKETLKTHVWDALIAERDAPGSTKLKPSRTFLFNGDVWTATLTTKEEDGKVSRSFAIKIDGREKHEILAPSPGHFFRGYKVWVDSFNATAARMEASNAQYRKELAALQAQPEPVFEQQDELDRQRREIQEIEDALVGKDEKEEEEGAGDGEAPANPAPQEGGETSLEKRLGEIADDATKRMEERARQRGTRLNANPIPDPRDLADAAILIAAEASRQLVRGGRAFTDLARTLVTRTREDLLPYLDEIRAAARAILKQDMKNGAKIAATVEALHVATEQLKAQGKRAKMMTGIETRGAAETAAQRTAEAALKEIERAYTRGRRAGLEEAQTHITSLIAQTRKLTSLAHAIDRMGKESAAQAKIDYDNALRAREGIRQQVIDQARAMPAAVRGALISTITNATTPAGYVRALRLLQARLYRYRGREDWAWIKKRTTRMKLLAAKGLADADRATVRGLRETAENARAVLLDPQSNVTQLRNAAIEIQQARKNIGIVLEAMAAGQRRLTGMRRLTAIKAAEEIVARVEKAKKPIETHKEERDPDVSAPVKLWRRLRDVRNMIQEVDGIGHELETVMWDRPERAEEQYLALVRDKTRELEDAARRAGFNSLSRAMDAMSGHAGRGVTRYITATIEGKERRLTLGEALALLAHESDPMTKALIHEEHGVGFQSARGRHTRGFNPTPREIERIRALADPEGTYARLIDDIKGIFESMRPDAFRVHKILTGSEPEAVPGRWPRPRNLQASAAAVLPDIDSPAGMAQRVIENDPMFEARKQTGGVMILLIDPISVALDQIERSAKVARLALPINDAAQVLLRPNVRTTVSERFGATYYEDLKRHLIAMSRVDAVGTPGAKAAAWVNQNAAIAFLGTNPGTWAANMLSAIRLIPFMGVGPWLAGVAGARRVKMSTLAENSGYFHDRYNANAAARFSAMMEGGTHDIRAEGIGRDLARTARNIVVGDAGATYRNGRRAAAQFLRILNWFDALVARTAWAGFDHIARTRRPGWSPEQRTRWVALKARRVIRETQNGSSPMDMAVGATRARDSVLAMATLFTSDSLKARNRIARAYRLGKAQGTKVLAAELVTIAMAAPLKRMLWGALAAAVAAALGWDDDDAERLAKKFSPVDVGWGMANEVSNLLAPVLGPSALSVVRGIGRGEIIQTPGESLINDVAVDFSRAFKATHKWLSDDDANAAKALTAWARVLDSGSAAVGLNPLHAVMQRVIDEAEKAIED